MSAPVCADQFQDIQDGITAYVLKDYKTALEKLKPLAEKGNAIAQKNIGIMYSKGYGVKQDYTEAIKWDRLSAEQGNASAQSNIGIMYTNGFGVKKDLEEGIKWTRKAVKQGAGPQNNLGWLYEKGLGVSQDYQEAVKWYKLSAELGDETAQQNLGELYRDGLGVVQDLKEAIRWLGLSAKQKTAAENNEYAHPLSWNKVIKGDYYNTLSNYDKGKLQEQYFNDLVVRNITQKLPVQFFCGWVLVNHKDSVVSFTHE